MVKIRLKRLGSKQKPFYRVVVADAKVKRDGKYIELVGTYDPKFGIIKINKEIALKWLQNGAQPTRIVRSIFSHEGIMTEFANLKNKTKLIVNSKTGQRFGKKVNAKIGYHAPGTKPIANVKEIKEKVAQEATIEKQIPKKKPS